MHLHYAGAIERVRRSVYRITQRSRELLTRYPDWIDVCMLQQFRRRSGRRRRQARAAATELTSPCRTENRGGLVRETHYVFMRIARERTLGSPSVGHTGYPRWARLPSPKRRTGKGILQGVEGCQRRSNLNQVSPVNFRHPHGRSFQGKRPASVPRMRCLLHAISPRLPPCGQATWVSA